MTKFYVTCVSVNECTSYLLLRPSLQQVFILRHKLCFRLSLTRKHENISLQQHNVIDPCITYYSDEELVKMFPLKSRLH